MVDFNLDDELQQVRERVRRFIDTEVIPCEEGLGHDHGKLEVLRGELIGLMPLDAAVQVTADALRLEGLTRERIIESHFIR